MHMHINPPDLYAYAFQALSS